KAVGATRQYFAADTLGTRYQLNFLPEGLYLQHSVVDVNGNQRWDKGSAVPWHYAEPFLFKEDTVKVRKRWTTEGQDFQFNFRIP
ncbi:MAG: hypothetical protein WAN36_06670, partial [Calditrichia bacterium]